MYIYSRVNMNFGKKIYKYKEDILKDLKTLMEIESVTSNRNKCKEALDFILNKANEFGLVALSVDNIAGHVQLGNSGKLCGVLTHLDVVPAGNNWSCEPFTLTEKDNRLYGRGIADNKGAALLNLYCLKALKDENIQGINTLRCIYGTEEETGMADIKKYFLSNPVPDISFTPDADYGICNAEKGILQLEVSMDRNDGKLLSAVTSGNAINAVPDEASALIYSSELEAENIISDSKNIEGNFKFTETIDGLVIKSYGKSAHACEPEKGFNAALALIELLNNHLSSDEVGKLCSFVGFALRSEFNGTSLGIKMRDFASGDLTCTMGKIRLNDSKAYLTLDIRYPVTMNGEKILNQVTKVAKLKDLQVKVINHSLPLYLPKNSSTIDLLSSAYEDVMGEKPELYSTGGGTYARVLGNKGVAFGPAFKGDQINMHNADESMDADNFFKHGEICLQTMYKLFTEKL